VILYTTMPLETVLQGLEDLHPSYLEMEVSGARVVIEETSLGQGRIVRLLSTDPQDYLNPALQPGMTINFIPSGS